MQALTGEIAFFNGKTRINGSFCYVPQESCKCVSTNEMIMSSDIIVGIFPSTVKRNILFEKEYQDNLFRRVIHAAALEPVFLFIIRYVHPNIIFCMFIRI